MASALPSSRRQISATAGASASVSRYPDRSNGARGEQFDCGKLSRLVCRGALAGIAFQPAKTMYALAADPQGLAARRENAHVIEVADKSIHGSSHGRQQMLAIVEQKDLLLGLQRMHDAGERISARHTKAERRRDRLPVRTASR